MSGFYSKFTNNVLLINNTLFLDKEIKFYLKNTLENMFTEGVNNLCVVSNMGCTLNSEFEDIIPKGMNLFHYILYNETDSYILDEINPKNTISYLNSKSRSMGLLLNITSLSAVELKDINQTLINLYELFPVRICTSKGNMKYKTAWTSSIKPNNVLVDINSQGMSTYLGKQRVDPALVKLNIKEY